jgi:hypothetical protein
MKVRRSQVWCVGYNRCCGGVCCLLCRSLALTLARSLNGTIQVYKGFNQSTGGFLAIKELRIDDLQVLCRPYARTCDELEKRGWV